MITFFVDYVDANGRSCLAHFKAKDTEDLSSLLASLGCRLRTCYKMD